MLLKLFLGSQLILMGLHVSIKWMFGSFHYLGPLPGEDNRTGIFKRCENKGGGLELQDDEKVAPRPGPDRYPPPSLTLHASKIEALHAIHATLYYKYACPSLDCVAFVIRVQKEVRLRG